MKKLILSFIMSIAVFVGYALAANYNNPVDGIVQGIYGDYISVTVGSPSPKSSDFGAPGDLNFTVNSNTYYHDFHQLTDLHPGDHVQVEYTEDPQGKSRRLYATNITKIPRTTVTRAVEYVAPTTTTVIPTGTTTTVMPTSTTTVVPTTTTTAVVPGTVVTTRDGRTVTTTTTTVTNGNTNQ